MRHFPVGITKDGRWLACRPTPEAMADGSWEQGDCTPCVLSPDRRDHGHLAAAGRQGGAGPH